MDTATTAFSGAAEQARMLAAGMATSPQLLEMYLERIGRLDPRLNAYRAVRAENVDWSGAFVGSASSTVVASAVSGVLFE